MRNANLEKSDDEIAGRHALNEAIGRIEYGQMLRSNTLTLPRRIVFGNGTARNVGQEARAFEAKNILVVTGPRVAESGLLTCIMESFRTEGMQIEVFSDVEPEPSINTANRIADFVRGREFDLVCGVGGGSTMDIAKIAAVAPTNPGEIRSYVGVNLLTKPGLPKILLPTTAGTASEMTPNAIVGLHDEGVKAAMISPYILTDVAVVDPSLTRSLPPKPTAVSGLDALTHAIESYVSLDANPITSLLSLRAIELIAQNLSIAFHDGANLHARSAMSLASMMAGISIANAGTCSGHAAAYGYAAKYGIPHGFSVAVALPHILEFSLVSCTENATAIAEAMGVTTSGLSSADVVKWAVHAVVRLMQEVQSPMSLSQLGIPKTEIPSIAQEMLKTRRLMVHNPRPVSESEALEIITKMWEGKSGRSLLVRE